MEEREVVVVKRKDNLIRAIICKNDILEYGNFF